MSPRVISSGKDPPVFSNKDRRKAPSSGVELVFAYASGKASTSKSSLHRSNESHTNSKSLGDAWEIPNRFNRELGHCQFSKLIETYLLIRDNATITNTLFKLRQFHMLNHIFAVSIAFLGILLSFGMH